MRRGVRNHVPEVAVLAQESVAFRALLPQDRRGLACEVRYDFEKSDVVGERVRVLANRAVDGKRTYHLALAYERDADERKRVVALARLSAVQEPAVLAYVGHNLGLARLCDKACYALANVVAPEGASLRVQFPRRSLYPKLVSLQEDERAAQHPHAAVQYLKHALK